MFDGFDETDFSYYSVFSNLIAIFYLVGVTPFLSDKLKLHDALILFIIVSFEGVSLCVTPLATELWHFYIVTGFNMFGYCKYSVLRSLLSKSFANDEIGKVFSVLAVLAALAPVAGNPIFRQLYNSTLERFPGAAFLLAGLMMLVAALGNLVIYFNRNNLVEDVEAVAATDEKNGLELSDAEKY